MSYKKFSWWSTVDTMTRAGVQFAEGLSVGEMSAVESYLGTRLPPDHRALLRDALPVGPGFPNWRELGSEALERQLSWPFDSLAEDIVRGKFWWPERWGPRPAGAQEALAVARRDYDKAPRMVPVYDHAYLPAAPSEPYNPVFARDYGVLMTRASCLRTYLDCELGDLESWEPVAPKQRWVRFWDALAYARLRMQPPEVLWPEFRRRDKKWMPEDALAAAAV